jgi:hypothetical protein
LTHTSMTFRKFESHAWNAAAISALLKNSLTHMAHIPMRDGAHETNQKALDQADAENRADLFRVHVLRGRGLIERD